MINYNLQNQTYRQVLSPSGKDSLEALQVLYYNLLKLKIILQFSMPIMMLKIITFMKFKISKII